MLQSIILCVYAKVQQHFISFYIAETNPVEDSYDNGIPTAPLPQNSFTEDEGDDYNSFDEYIPDDVFERSFEEDLGYGADISIGEDTSIGEEVSILEGIPEEDADGAGQDSVNMTIVEEVEVTTIVYETTPPNEEEIVEGPSNNYFEPSIVEGGMYEPSIYEEPFPQDSVLEYTEPDSFAGHQNSFVEDYGTEETDQTGPVNDTTHVSPKDSAGMSPPEATNEPQEETTDPVDESHQTVTDKTYIYEEYVEYVEYEEGSDYNPPTAGYNPGGGDPGSIPYEGPGSIPEGGPGLSAGGSIPEFDESYDYEAPVEDIGK